LSSNNLGGLDVIADFTSGPGGDFASGNINDF
jgi:hypothetical protein